MSAITGKLVTETLNFDGGRQVTAYIPSSQPEAIIFAGDGHQVPQWASVLEASSNMRSTMIVGTHRLEDEMLRLQEYSPVFDATRFSAHEQFFIEYVRQWAYSQIKVTLPAQQTAVFGVSAGGELALAMGVRHPDIFGTVLCASPGGGYKPPKVMLKPPRSYLVAGTLEPFFLENARAWTEALRTAGAEVIMTERVGSHGDAFWKQEFPLMVSWAFGY
jgi:enterochelin esterase-like enzyme